MPLQDLRRARIVLCLRWVADTEIVQAVGSRSGFGRALANDVLQTLFGALKDALRPGPPATLDRPVILKPPVQVAGSRATWPTLDAVAERVLAFGENSLAGQLGVPMNVHTA